MPQCSWSTIRSMFSQQFNITQHQHRLNGSPLLPVQSRIAQQKVRQTYSMFFNLNRIKLFLLQQQIGKLSSTESWQHHLLLEQEDPVVPAHHLSLLVWACIISGYCEKRDMLINYPNQLIRDFISDVSN